MVEQPAKMAEAKIRKEAFISGSLVAAPGVYRCSKAQRL
jgi:hypothetical protein